MSIPHLRRSRLGTCATRDRRNVTRTRSPCIRDPLFVIKRSLRNGGPDARQEKSYRRKNDREASEQPGIRENREGEREASGFDICAPGGAGVRAARRHRKATRQL